MSLPWLEKIKEGDVVHRYLAGINKPMKLKVTEITIDIIKCGDWEFSKHTGGEIDKYLGWDGIHTTGSLLRENHG